MKRKTKKGITFALALSMVIGMGSMAVSADELEMVAEESPYDVCSELDLTDAEVEEIIAKTAEMARAEGMSEDEIDELVSVWYKEPQISTYSVASTTATSSRKCKNFLVCISVPSGTWIPSPMTYSLTYYSTDFEPHYTNYGDGNNKHSYVGYSIPNASIYDLTATHDGNTLISTINGHYGQTATGGNGVAFKFDYTGTNDAMLGYTRYAQCNLSSFTSFTQASNREVIALGDIARATNSDKGVIDSDDMQILQDYIVNMASISDIDREAIDIIRDGVIDIKDVGMINRYRTSNIDDLWND